MLYIKLIHTKTYTLTEKRTLKECLIDTENKRFIKITLNKDLLTSYLIKINIKRLNTAILNHYLKLFLSN